MIPLTKRGKGEERRGRKDVVIKTYLLDIKWEISKRELNMHLVYIIAF